MEKYIIGAALAFICSINDVNAAIDYNEPIEGYTAEEIKEKTYECMSKRLHEMQTDKAVEMLELICYQEITKR